MPRLTILDPVGKIPFVGKKYERLLSKLEIATVQDLLHHYPSRYNDYSKVKKISELTVGENATVQGEIAELKTIRTRYQKFLTRGVVSDGSGSLNLVWFNQPYISKTIKAGDRVSLSGKLGEFDYRPALVSPEYEKDGAERIHTGGLVPVYPETVGLSSKWLRRRINATIEQLNSGTIGEEEFLPEEVRGRHNLIDLWAALNQIHFPQSQEEIRQARKRLAFDELFLMQLKTLYRRRQWQKQKLACPLSVNRYRSEIDAFIKTLPFELTDAQKRCVAEILGDLEKERPMNRLLEGDVGAGKTVVATIALFATHLNGARSALMAPTEVLAKQHYQSIKEFLDPFGVKVGLQTGSTKMAKWPDGQMVDVLIGTHALLYDSALLDRLGLVVVDEQHRFGVEQRAKLIKTPTEGGGISHTLTMTATPIPRSLALTVYGDLSLSVLDEMPPGRRAVRTWVVPPRKRNAAYQWSKSQIVGCQSQAFIICPLIEESEHETMRSVKAATAEYDKLQKSFFPDLKLGLLHGRMKSKEKDEVLNKFRSGEFSILVSTPVVEVGIDIPNATLMIVEGAERFGLASLHQLRGRVGRGGKQSFCLLMSKHEGGPSFNRLKAMERFNSGFKLAEIDLKLRGPGEFFGIRQHGLLKLRLNSLSDIEKIQKTRAEANEVIKNLDKYPKLCAKIGEKEVQPC